MYHVRITRDGDEVFNEYVDAAIVGVHNRRKQSGRGAAFATGAVALAGAVHAVEHALADVYEDAFVMGAYEALDVEPAG